VTGAQPITGDNFGFVAARGMHITSPATALVFLVYRDSGSGLTHSGGTARPEAQPSPTRASLGLEGLSPSTHLRKASRSPTFSAQQQLEVPCTGCGGCAREWRL
jgi:hypothetical protein